MEKLGIFVLGVIFVLLAALFMALPTMLAWDVIMPKYFGLKEITFFDAMVLNVLASCLFKSTNSKDN